jgi:putative glutamine amidotransferase
MRVGITDTLKEDKFERYVRWIRSAGDCIEIEKLSCKLNNAEDIEKLDGLFLSGGGYGKGNQLDKTNGIDEERDEFEFAVIERALDAEMPILGICRGMQVMNVYLGGSLVIDLVSEGFHDHTSPSTSRATKHEVAVIPHSLLHALTGAMETKVNSFHHQSIHQLGKGLMCSAISPDNVVESAEWMMKDNMPFLMLVQWHPERMMNTFLSQKLASLFLREVQYTQSTKKNYQSIAP